ncbi:type III-B CRISPR module-associated protein Cmr3 [Paenibacillus hunanensis]|uniref:type III-B CRISPR module-associated protein Cmr3 n=1 Tax=Paenibacillus hunanensis TaxID=539262 RepID=UPI002026B3E5|nr:type III-B CRISPR module-associated protein Cmr3 [Paenibacillus hunanensis]MCL9662164.1 type III-B CRISPR module-associated protein Cmr3 [Paenibacillus hunanensis]
MKTFIRVQPLDPIMIRDGRPFTRTPGIRAHTLNHISPSVLAGSIRTLLTKRAQASEGTSTNYKRLTKTKIRGPVYVWKDQMYFAVPQDAQVYENGEHLHIQPVEPQPKADEDSGFFGTGKMGLYDDLWLPKVSVSPVAESKSGEYKLASKQPTHVSAAYMYRWLSQPTVSFRNEYADQVKAWQEELKTSTLKPEQDAFLPLFQKEERTHIERDLLTSRAKDQQLFNTQSLVLPKDLTLQAEVILPEQELWREGLSEIHPMGGKRRLAHFTEEHTLPEDRWNCPDEVAQALENQSYFRIVLATPAYFRRGWLPSWLNEDMESNDSFGKLFNTTLRVRLRWACVPRWEAVSGWRMEKTMEQDKESQATVPSTSSKPYKGEGHEKAIRRMVPAGSVYFFEVIEDAQGVKGNPAELAKAMWLQSISDTNRRHEAFDQEDGCGLALWGVWHPDL